jgi:RNA polymerase sigma-54 factor
MKSLGSYSELAREVLENRFELLQRKKFKEIARKIDGATEKDIIELHRKVGLLDPKPGRMHSKEPTQYIKPDVFVKLIDGELVIYLEEGSSGHLSVNRLYRRLLRLQERALTKEEKAYALEKFRGALMLIKNIEKRKSTILRVTESIMQVQREFLTKGVSALRPLTLREVADMVGMHESTIARVTSKKYVETPQGLYPLKFFFSSAIASSNGTEDTVSSRSIKDKLATLIEQEDPKRPLSDQRLAQMLNDGGYTIARRTVAKYREQLKILPAKLRREA